MGTSTENKVDDIIEEIMNHENTKDRVDSMKKRADLSDIILEKEKSSISVAQKKKKFLLATASLVLLFLIFLIISKMLNSSSSDTVSEDINNTEKVVKESIVKDNPEEKEKSNEVSPDSDTDMKFNELVKKLREQDAKENGNNIVVEKKKSLTPQIEEPKKESSTPPKASIEEIKKEPIKPKIDISSTPISKPAVHKVKTKIVSKPIYKPTHKQPTCISSFSRKSGYYIQVGATTSPIPNRALVNKIKNSGYSYITTPIVVKGRRFYKVLVGPYKSKEEALNNIESVRVTINPKAYIYHLR